MTNKILHYLKTNGYIYFQMHKIFQNEYIYENTINSILSGKLFNIHLLKLCHTIEKKLSYCDQEK